MATINSGPSLSGKFPKKKKKREKSALELVLSTGFFFIIMGLLIAGTGDICFMAFRNPFSKLLLDMGIIMCIFGFAVKITDIVLKITGR